MQQVADMHVSTNNVLCQNSQNIPVAVQVIPAPTV